MAKKAKPTSIATATTTAREFIAALKAAAAEKPQQQYLVPMLAAKAGSYFFGDATDAAIVPFLSLDREDAAQAFHLAPLAGITAEEAAGIFCFDEDEALVYLTSFALAVIEQSKSGTTQAVISELKLSLLQLILHLEKGVNAIGCVDLPRRTKA